MKSRKPTGHIVLFLETDLSKFKGFNESKLSAIQKMCFDQLSDQEKEKVRMGYGTSIIDCESEETICRFNMETYRPPKHALESFARSLLPIIEEFYQDEYLVLLDLIYEVDSRSFPNVNDIGKITVVSQPGMRYAQAQALVKSLLLDDKFKELNLDERTQVIERILSEIRGRMMEDIILLETKLAQPSKEVFKLQFTVGEFDMVVFNPDTASCEIYEIKYSTEIVEQQYQHLVNEEKCEQTAHRFGTIKGKYVLYRGETQDVNGILPKRCVNISV